MGRGRRPDCITIYRKINNLPMIFDVIKKLKQIFCMHTYSSTCLHYFIFPCHSSDPVHMALGSNNQHVFGTKCQTIEPLFKNWIAECWVASQHICHVWWEMHFKATAALFGIYLIKSYGQQCFIWNCTYVTLDNETSHKGQFFEIEIFTSSEQISFPLMYGLLWYDHIWLRYNYLKIWNLRVQ